MLCLYITFILTRFLVTGHVLWRYLFLLFVILSLLIFFYFFVLIHFFTKIRVTELQGVLEMLGSEGLEAEVQWLLSFYLVVARVNMLNGYLQLLMYTLIMMSRAVYFTRTFLLLPHRQEKQVFFQLH